LCMQIRQIEKFASICAHEDPDGEMHSYLT